MMILTVKPALSGETLRDGIVFDLPVSTASFITFNAFAQDSARYIWTVDAPSRQIAQIDIKTLSVKTYVPFPGQFCEDICWENRTQLWVSDSEEKQIKLISIPGGKILKKFPSPGGGPSGIAIFNGYLWNVDFQEKKLFKLNRLDGNVLSQYSIPAFGEGIVAAHDALYLIAENQLHKFDITTGKITNSYLIPISDAVGVAWDGAKFYISPLNSNKIFSYTLK